MTSLSCWGDYLNEFKLFKPGTYRGQQKVVAAYPHRSCFFAPKDLHGPSIENWWHAIINTHTPMWNYVI